MVHLPTPTNSSRSPERVCFTTGGPATGRPFSFAGRGPIGSPVLVSRKTFRIILVALLLISGAFASWSWLRPYEWSADPRARAKIVGCLVERDHSNYWVRLKLRIPDGEKHDLEQPVRLLTHGGDNLEPADTTLEGDEKQAVRVVWLKFWLEEKQMKGSLSLKINEGKLTVRSGNGFRLPDLRSDDTRYFVTHRW